MCIESERNHRAVSETYMFREVGALGVDIIPEKTREGHIEKGHTTRITSILFV